MKNVLCSVLVLVTCLALLAAAPEEKAPKPQYDQNGQLIRPADYREWMFLSAGYGMNYSPGPDSHEMFTNVFVQRWAYSEFANSGKWPEQSMFVIDERDAASRSSINQKGHYQTDLTGLVVEVKDSARNPDKWAYYFFRRRRQNGRGHAQGQRLLVVPRRSCRRRAHVCAVLSHAEGSGEEVRDIQRSAGASDGGEVKEAAARERMNWK